MKHKMLNLDDMLVHNFRCQIEEGKLKYGERIKPERDLASALHIHRNTVRQGMARLVNLGFFCVNSRKGYNVAERRILYRTDMNTDFETLFAGDQFLWEREEETLSETEIPEEWFRVLPPGKKLVRSFLTGRRAGKVLCTEQEFVLEDDSNHAEEGIFTGWKMDIRYAEAGEAKRFRLPLLSPLLCIWGYWFHTEGFPVRFQERKLLPDRFEFRAMDLEGKDEIDS